MTCLLSVGCLVMLFASHRKHLMATWRRLVGGVEAGDRRPESYPEVLDCSVKV